jgi:hypothetical protein
LSVRKQQPVGDEDPTDNEGYPNQIIGVESDPNPPIIAVSIQLLVHARLCLATELFRTCSRHRRVRRLASGYNGPATLLDERSPIPRRDFLEFGQLFGGTGLVLEFLDADWRQRGDDRSFRSLIGHLFGSAAKHPSEPAKAQDHDRYRTGHRTPCRRFAPWMSLHLLHRRFRRNPLLPRGDPHKEYRAAKLHR